MVLGNEPNPNEETSSNDHDDPVVCLTLAEYCFALDVDCEAISNLLFKQRSA